MSIEERQKNEKRNVRLFINGIINHETFFKDLDETQTSVAKLKVLEEKLKKIFDFIRIIMSAYRGGNDSRVNSKIMSHGLFVKNFKNLTNFYYFCIF
jgi:hypothetical protein